MLVLLIQILCVMAYFVTLLCLSRLKNGLPLPKDYYRVKGRNDSLTIRGIVETDAGNYTMVLTNRITREEQRHTIQLLVNGM